MKKNLRRKSKAFIFSVCLLEAVSCCAVKAETVNSNALNSEEVNVEAMDASGTTVRQTDGGSAAGSDIETIDLQAAADNYNLQTEAPAADPSGAKVEIPAMTYEEFPKIDGSLACVPLMENLAIKITGCSEIEAEETLSDFSNTNPCYLYLAKGERDLLLAYEPADETKQKLGDYAPLTMEPVGRDGLVFIVNKDNPVESLTKEQLYAIYTGKITNWKEVGGLDQPIKVFSRPETSGSQTLMRKLLLGDAEMAEGMTEKVESMEGIIDRLLDYDNSASAIGYSVYYYASSMYDQPALKFLSVDGVQPSTDSIRTGKYPLINDFYVVTN